MPERFSASNAAKHMACPASADLESAIPNFTRPPKDDVVRASDVGTSAHEVFEKLMQYSAADMRHWIAVLSYIEALRSTRRFKVLTEVTVEATWLDPDPATGEYPTTTVDLVLYTQDEIHIIDLKWGKILVEVWDNEQLLYYAACFAKLAPKAKGVTIHIVQPKADNMNAQFVDTIALGTFMAQALEAQRKIHKGDRTFGPSDHCKFCPAYPHSRSPKGTPLCPATMQLLYPTISVDEDEIFNL